VDVYCGHDYKMILEIFFLAFYYYRSLVLRGSGHYEVVRYNKRQNRFPRKNEITVIPERKPRERSNKPRGCFAPLRVAFTGA
jgi:hypothetical protein